MLPPKIIGIATGRIYRYVQFRCQKANLIKLKKNEKEVPKLRSY